MKTNIEQLRERIQRNYEDFKAETLETLDKEDIFEMAQTIAATEDVYHFITTYSGWVDEGEAAYLLAFCEPLKLLADAWEEYLCDGEQDFRMIVEEVLDRNDNTDSYITVALADKLRKKYGENMHYKDALLAEAIAAGKKYLQLKGLLEDEGVDLCIERE